MAGIGFELKRLFEKEGIVAKVRAYGYASFVVSGPMILGIILLLGVLFLAQLDGAARPERELLISLFTYSMLFSLITSSVLSVICTRYLADALYMKRRQLILPSFYGSVGLTLAMGGLLYGTFLLFSGVPIAYQVLSFLFYMTLLVVWLEMNYLTAVSDYKSVILTFAAAIGILFLLGFGLTRFTQIDTAVAMLSSAWLAYGVMAVRYYALLLKYFPKGSGSPLHFLRWIERYPTLFFLGILQQIGLYGHLIIMWNSPLEVPVMGLFHGAPIYDVSALIAILSILVTSVSFVTSVEIRFYPEYHKYFTLLNYGGNITDIEETEKKMLRVLNDEMGYLAIKQVITTIVFISLGTVLLTETALGFTSDMLGIFRILCLGYAFYAIGNSLLLILLYFEDHKGAFQGALLLAATTNIFTFIIKDWDSSYYGLGFVLGAAIFALYMYLRLNIYLSRLKYHIIAQQPIHALETRGPIVQMVERLEKYQIKNEE